MEDTTDENLLEKEESEFGKGLTYCLGLFLAHAERHTGYASLPQKLKKRLEDFQSECLDLGHGCGLWNQDIEWKSKIQWAIQEAKDLLRAIDEVFGVHTIKSDYE